MVKLVKINKPVFFVLKKPPLYILILGFGVRCIGLTLKLKVVFIVII